MVRRWFVGVLFAVTTMFVGQAAATVVSPLNFDELVKSADIVVHGFVVEQWTEAPDGLPGLIYTYTLVEVAQTLKGEPEKRMTLRHIGGDLGGYSVNLTGSPEFSLGSEIVVFAGRDNAESPYVSVGLSQGVFRVSRTDGSLKLSRNLSGLTFYNPAVRHFSPDPMPDRLGGD